MDVTIFLVFFPRFDIKKKMYNVSYTTPRTRLKSIRLHIELKNILGIEFFV